MDNPLEANAITYYTHISLYGVECVEFVNGITWLMSGSIWKILSANFGNKGKGEGFYWIMNNANRIICIELWFQVWGWSYAAFRYLLWELEFKTFVYPFNQNITIVPLIVRQCVDRSQQKQNDSYLDSNAIRDIS